MLNSHQMQPGKQEASPSRLAKHTGGETCNCRMKLAEKVAQSGCLGQQCSCFIRMRNDAVVSCMEIKPAHREHGRALIGSLRLRSGAGVVGVSNRCKFGSRFVYLRTRDTKSIMANGWSG